jgi:drug/metabolite transporter (DMT)-like permease
MDDDRAAEGVQILSPRAGSPAAPSPLLFALLAVAMVIWGGSWPSAKSIAEVASPEVNVFWRFLLTSVAFLPILLATRSSLRVSPRGLLLTAAAAALLVLYNLAFFAGLRLGLASVGGELVPTLSPILTVLFGFLVARRRAARLVEIVGIVLGFVGGMIILRVWAIGGSDLLRSGNLLFLAAAGLWAVLTLLSARAQREITFLPFSFLMYAFATLFAFPVALTGRIGSVFTGGWAYWLNLAYLAVVATAFATTVYFMCSARLGASRASAFMFIVPTAAVLLSWLFIGEVPTASAIVGGVLSIAAVYLVNSRPA